MNTYEISYYDNGELKRITIEADSGLSEILSIINRGDDK